MSTTTPTWSTVPVDVLPRLTVDGRDTGLTLWTARTRRERNIGLLGTDSIDGALWITRCNWVHCFRMRHTIDVVYVGRRGRVVAVTTMPPNRMGMPRPLARAVVEMRQGDASRLGIHRGSVLATAPTEPPPWSDPGSAGVQNNVLGSTH
ncbi:hypothetical protein BKH30_00405 [Actinomyces oris]|uniref:DUF192 domain-containing protein n=1 Tax=Actinomyces oris TaxID=544580 RepID=A0A1Q8W4B8_9ACTO|nr:hypothetical protein BKH30_00405 [Actinomyces oris]